jgi:hypothetical protein
MDFHQILENQNLLLFLFILFNNFFGLAPYKSQSKIPKKNKGLFELAFFHLLTNIFMFGPKIRKGWTAIGSVMFLVPIGIL